MNETGNGLSTDEVRQHYADFSRLLLDRRNEILGRESATRSQLDEQVLSSPGDVGDSSVIDTSADYYLNLADTQRHELLEIRDALDRMHVGTYGICLSCENPIATQRLEKLPYARFCIDCQSAEEAQKRAARLQILPKM